MQTFITLPKETVRADSLTERQLASMQQLHESLQTQRQSHLKMNETLDSTKMSNDLGFEIQEEDDKKLSILEVLSLKSIQDTTSDDPCDKLIEKEIIRSTVDEFVSERMAVVEKAMDEKQAVLFAEQFNSHRNTMTAIFKDRESRA